MKKNICALFLTLSTITGLASCEKVDDEYYSIQIWTYYNGDTESSFQSIVDEYNNTRGIEKKIVVSSLSQGTKVSDLLDALLDSATNKLGSSPMPDLFLAYPDCAFELDKYDKIVSLENYFTSEELKEFNKGFLDEGRIGKDNALKILPVSKSTEALYINKTDFDKFLEANPNLNLSYSNLSTIEGLIDVSKAYYETTGKAFFGRDSLDNYFVISAKQLGIDILHYDDNGQFKINFDEEVFKKLWDSYYVPYVKGYFGSVGRFRSDDVKTGAILSYIGSTSSGGYFPKTVIESKDSSYPIEAMVLETPTFANKPKYAVSQGAGFCITKSTKEKEQAAVDFLKWLCKEENITKFAGSSGYFPATTSGFSESFINNQNNSFKGSFKVAKQTTENFNMYTNVVGLNGTSYRNFLRDNLDNVSKNARNAVVAANMSEDVINEYTSDSKFSEWFLALKQEAEKMTS